MLVSHAPDIAVTSTDEKKAEKVPGLLEVLALVSDPRKRRGRRYLLVFVLAVAVACALSIYQSNYTSSVDFFTVGLRWYNPADETPPT